MTTERKPAPDQLAEDFLELFLEEEELFGTFDKERLHLVGDKLEMKDDKGQGPRDVKRPPTVADMRAHLDGHQPMGLRPVDKNGMTASIVIDIDGRDATPTKDGQVGYGAIRQYEIVRQITAFKLPLVDDRSKSSGVHLRCHLTRKIPQEEANALGRQMAEVLNFPKAEVPPPAEGRGGWVICPYFGDQEHGLISLARPLGNGIATAAAFAAHSKASRVTPEAVKLAVRQARKHRSDGGPELAQRKLAELVFEITEAREGTRAKTLFGRAKDLGSYVGAGWIDREVVFNALMNAATFENIMPLQRSDAAMHINNGLNAGEKEEPTVDESRYVKIARLIIWEGGEETEFEVALEGCEGTLRKPVREITNHMLFNDHCAATFKRRFRKMKQDKWDDVIDAALAVAEVRQVPPDETPLSAFLGVLREFCMHWRHGEERIEELVLAKPVYMEEEGRIYFRWSDLCKYIDDHRLLMFKGYGAAKLGRLMAKVGTEGADFGKTTKRYRGDKSKLEEVRWMRHDLFDATPVAPPPIKPDPI